MDIDDVTKLYVFDQKGRKICEAVSPELLAFGPHCSQAALEKHLRDQKRQERDVREFLEDMRRPYELRTGEGGRASEAVGMIDLTIKPREARSWSSSRTTRSSGRRPQRQPRRRKPMPGTSSSHRRQETPSHV